MALVAGGIGVVVAVALMAFFFGAGAPPTTSEGDSRPPTTVSPPTTSGPTGEPEGGLREIVEEVVGEFRLVRVASQEQLIAAGAVDALLAVYQHSDGTEVSHDLVLWSSAAQAGAAVEETRQALVDGGFELIGEDDLENAAGEVGRVAAYHLEGSEIVVWQIQAAFFTVGGPSPKPGDFFELVLYGFPLLDQGFG